ncbi:uncharacterized protein [Nicotiana tomentosiformis]|uniref:uncharacterized protein isoform X4 n=1 Tax=Nicotiana tomentosiformis TaxID=4098 RepID=UPI00051BEDFB|nr:uncharacterized protein LOC104099967 isoform X4 [Nicotiana tomentosiformis]
MRAAVTDKFESDDMDIHRNHILGWMKELWNKWRGQLHAKYVKGKPIQEALKNVPKGVDKKQWEWLVKEYFSTESFQARSNRNAANRTKLKMLHHIGSKPIREIIYQKAEKMANYQIWQLFSSRLARRITHLLILKQSRNMLKSRNWCSPNRHFLA